MSMIKRLNQFQGGRKLAVISLVSFTLLLNGCVDGVGTVLAVIGVLAGAAAVSSGGGGSDSSSSSSSSSSGSSSGSNTNTTKTNPFTVPSSISKNLVMKSYDGISDDLLTAGVGQTGIVSSNITYADSANPTAAELRRAAIITQYRANQDTRAIAGYGTLYGAGVPTRFATATTNGMVAGKEYLSFYDESTNQQNVAMMVQIPQNFDTNRPCIVVTTSPEARGIYGGVALAGEWGLKNRCAVAYTDKGMGIGLHDLTANSVNQLNGTRIVNSSTVTSHFSAQGNGTSDLSSYSSANTARVALKTAHSQQNPEVNAGKNVLEAVNFAFHVLNMSENYGNSTTINSANTIVIAAGLGTAGGAVLRAGEQDSQGWIDGVVAVNPIINVRKTLTNEGFLIQQGSRILYNTTYAKSFLDAMSFINLYQPCASAIFTNNNTAKGRCTALKAANLLTSSTLAEQVTESQQRLINFGVISSVNAIAHNYYSAHYFAANSMYMANSYGRFSVVDNLCDYSLAGSRASNSPITLTLTELAAQFASSNGMPPSNSTTVPTQTLSPISLINNNGNSGKGINYLYNLSSNSTADEYLSGASCIRQLALNTQLSAVTALPTTTSTTTTTTTTTTGLALSGTLAQQALQVQAGVQATYASADLRNKPVLIVQGRDDPLANANFHARQYFALSQVVGRTGVNASVRYLEILNANHLDGMNATFNLSTQIPMTYYFNKAMDALLDKLQNNSVLPANQVVATTSPARTAGQVTQANLPVFGSTNNCAISFDYFEDIGLTVPDCGSITNVISN